ncbi:hypothetical protein BH18THE1_BH18THE1_21780 [soil metagenome]
MSKLIEFESDPYSLFVFAINSPMTKEKYVPRLNKFFDFIGHYHIFRAKTWLPGIMNPVARNSAFLNSDLPLK